MDGELNKSNWKRGEWNAYVMMGEDKAERASRLKEVPEEWRASVRSHVETAFQIRKPKRKG